MYTKDVPQTERADEAAARKRVEAALGVPLVFVDFTGGVDYRFERGGHSCALEVTRLTDSAVKQGATAWSRRQSFPAPALRHSWRVRTNGHPRYRDLPARLIPALRELERHDIEEFSDTDVPMRVGAVVLQVLGEARIVQAKVFRTKGSDRKVFLSPMAGYTYTGPDSVAARIGDFVHDTQDVRAKLVASAAVERHVFLWTDFDTPGAVRRSFEGDDLPVNSPALPQEVTHLWICDEQLGRGWYWSPDNGWSWIPSPTSESSSD
jgi:hypothetical protein